MLILLVLSLFLVLAGYVVSALESVSSTVEVVGKVYAKQQGYHALVSVLPHITSALSGEDRSFDSLMDPWSFPVEVETEEGYLRVVIVDEDRFLNLNKVAEDRKVESALRRLLEMLNIDPAKVDSLKELLKRKKLRSLYDLKDAGFSGEEIARLEGFVTVFSSGRVNVNTAPKEVLLALDPGIDPTVAERILERRISRPFRRVEDLVLVEGINFDVLYRIGDLIDVRSGVFRVEASVRVGDVETTAVLVYDRESGRVLFKRID
ncbi:MAG: type II secretion system protein GspK [Aquificota bacterium]|nr:type II secretion system protein GspK [Aquificota bacterium]